MSEKIRLDKYLADLSVGTRSEVKVMIRKGRITVNDTVILNPETKIETASDVVAFDGNVLAYTAYEYYILNKPAGVISASSDKRVKTVVDLIDSAIRGDLFPVGRLDKDTEGLLIITNDGDFTHRLLSPKKHVDKVYFAVVRGRVDKEDVYAFSKGLQVDDELTAMPAELKILKTDIIYSEIELTLHEGKFHQVKRMIEAVGKEVVYLKRISMGGLILPVELAPGEYRELTKEELESFGIASK